MKRISKEIMKEIIVFISAIIQTLFTWKIINGSGFSIVYIFILIAYIFLDKKALQIKDKRIWKISSILSILFTIAQIISRSISVDFTLNHIMDLIIILRLFYNCNGNMHNII